MRSFIQNPLFSFLILFTVPVFSSYALVDDSKDACHLNLTSSPLMKTTRIDRHAPCNCKPFKVSQFSDRNIDYFIGGINSTNGADTRIDLDREDARTLWNSLNESKSASFRAEARGKLDHDRQLVGYYNSLNSMKDLYGFDFVVEGEVLEALSLLDLEEKYPKDKYFATGGIMYFEKKGGNVTGELDLVVYERSSCEVVSIGEAKLSKSTSKAREQISRFRRFLSQQNRK